MSLPQLAPGVYWRKDRTVLTGDGARIAYTVLEPNGESHQALEDRPAVVLLSGFLCPDTWWHYLVPALRDAGRRVVLLHYRGIASSSAPERLDASTISIEAFASDVLDVLHDAAIDDVDLVGHSMGGQVMFEVARRIPDRVCSMVAVTATDRSPFDNLYGAGWLAVPAVGAAIRALRVLREPMGAAVYRMVWTAMPFLPLARAAKAFGPHTPADVLTSYSDHAVTLTGEYFVAVLHAMWSHRPDDAALAELDIPTLVITGDGDPFTPIRTARRMVRALPDATLEVVPDTTHAAIVEAPTEVNRAILRHLQRADAPVASGS